MKKSAIIFGALCAMSAGAYADGFYGAAEVGLIGLDLKKDYNNTGESKSENGINLGFALGYVSDYKIVLECGRTNTKTSTGRWSDNYLLNQTTLAVGYRFKLGNIGYAVPKLGVSNWRLGAEEYQIADTRDSAVKTSSRYQGSSLFAEMSLDFPINESFDWYIASSAGSYDFGNAVSAKAGVRWNF